MTALEENSINVTNSAVVATFVKSTKYSNSTSDEYTKYACELICEYLQPELSRKLHDHLGIVVSSTIEESTCIIESVSKKSKLEAVLSPTEDYSHLTAQTTLKKTEKKNAAQRQLEKVDTSGMKSMSSFFSAVSAKKKV